MAVLLRATTHISFYERALEERGIPTYVLGGRGYWSQQQVADLRAYLAALANPLDELALYSVLALAARRRVAGRARAARPAPSRPRRTTSGALLDDDGDRGGARRTATASARSGSWSASGRSGPPRRGSRSRR